MYEKLIRRKSRRRLIQRSHLFSALKRERATRWHVGLPLSRMLLMLGLYICPLRYQFTGTAAYPPETSGYQLGQLGQIGSNRCYPLQKRIDHITGFGVFVVHLVLHS
jgi:hypothetical protein